MYSVGSILAEYLFKIIGTFQVYNIQYIWYIKGTLNVYCLTFSIN